MPHSVIMPLKCTRCEQSFTDKLERRSHMRKFLTSKDARACCGQTFQTLGLLNSHAENERTKEISSIGGETLRDNPITAIKSADGRNWICTISRAQCPLANICIALFVSYDNSVCRSVEQYYQVRKCKTYCDSQTLAKVLSAYHPYAVKRFGSRVEGYDEREWLQACDEKWKMGREQKCGNIKN